MKPSLHPHLWVGMEPGNAALRNCSGKQVALVDSNGQPINASDFLAQRKQAALQGSVYTPQLGYQLVRGIGSGLKYPYNPYYGEFSPRVSFAWNPHYSDGILGKVFGNGKTVLRGGYSRIFGRLNGVDLVLVPLLGPGLLQGVTCVNPLKSGTCAWKRRGRPYHGVPHRHRWLDGAVGGGRADHSAALLSRRQRTRNPSTPSRWIRTSSRTAPTTSRLTIQRELNSHMHLEVGYIGKIIKNEYQELNMDSVPTMETLGGQSFRQRLSRNSTSRCSSTA